MINQIICGQDIICKDFVIDCRLANAILEKNNIVFSETKLPADILNLSALYYVNCKSYNPKFKLDVML